jgi:NAD(P)-dependent dehydrogenase (short-subunit alcohol dehydrogenase family)
LVLTNRLLDRVTAAPQGRVVVVGSVAHRQAPAGGMQFDDLSGKGWERQAYGHSKLANGLFSLELAKRLAGTKATSSSLHPGVVATNIMRNLNVAPPGGISRRRPRWPASAASISPTAIPPSRATTRRAPRWRLGSGRSPRT